MGNEIENVKPTYEVQVRRCLETETIGPDAACLWIAVALVSSSWCRACHDRDNPVRVSAWNMGSAQVCRQGQRRRSFRGQVRPRTIPDAFMLESHCFWTIPHKLTPDKHSPPHIRVWGCCVACADGCGVGAQVGDWIPEGRHCGCR